ncbi:hypothetical protein HK101_000404 [Irineochytrium annulatum]|nr:hypothetical protein HK101_000404 [Irineochytrium annulatum]
MSTVPNVPVPAPPPALTIRRAEPRDVKRIHLLTKDENEPDLLVSTVLRKRYGDYSDVAALIDVSPLSLVATDLGDSTVVGFCAFSNGPPPILDANEAVDGQVDAPISCGNWETWLRLRYECKDVHIHSSKFLSFFVAAQDQQLQFLDAALAATFNLLPSLKNICYLLPEPLTLFAPLSLSKGHAAAADAANEKDGHGVGAKTIKHVVKRKPRHIGGDQGTRYFNEINMKQPVTSPFNLNADHYLAELLESKNEASKTLVAEADGVVVGFMSLTKDVDQDVLTKNFYLDPFDNLVKEVPPDLLAEAEGGDLPQEADETASNYAQQLKADPIRAALEAMTPAAQAAAKVSAAVAAQQAAIAAAKALREQPNIFCISLLCIEDAYANQAIEFVKAAFVLYPDRDFCVVTVSTTLPEIPLFRSFISIPARPGKAGSNCLYIANRFGISELITIKSGRTRDTDAVGDLVKGLPMDVEIMTKYHHSLEDLAGEVKATPPFSSFIAESAGQVVGIAILEKYPNPANLSDQFNIEEFMSLRISKLDGPVMLKHMVINPIFSHQAKWFFEEILRMAGIPCILLKQMGLDHYVQVIKATTTEFDRVLKRVKLSNGAFVPYDYLFLTPGIQFFASNHSEELAALQGVCNLSVRDYEVLEFNIAKLARRNTNDSAFAVVYGRDIQAYTTVQTLISKGVPPQWIALVMPPSRHASGCFDNALVQQKNRETKVDLDLKSVELLVFCDEKSVDPDTFKSINDSCLVFDGRLVVDKYFRTQDPYIYAAGSITKYSSKYRTRWSHVYYDSRQVGEKMAEIILPLIDPLAPALDLDDNGPLLKFKAAKKIYGKMPGGLHYFHFDEPRLPGQTLELRQQKPDYGRDLVIDDETLGYFRIHVDPNGYIRSLTYLGLRPIPYENYCCLYMLHEKYLNRLVARFDEGIIPDFVRYSICLACFLFRRTFTYNKFSFLSETWALPIFHDRFIDFVTRTRQDILKSQSAPIAEITSTLVDTGALNLTIDDDEREGMYRKFTKSDVKPAMDDEVFSFLESTQATSDRIVGAGLMAVSVFVFAYYTLWALILSFDSILPFLDDSNAIQGYFPPREYAIMIPVLLLVVGVTLIGGFISFVLMKSGSKKKKT